MLGYMSVPMNYEEMSIIHELLLDSLVKKKEELAKTSDATEKARLAREVKTIKNLKGRFSTL